jgi:AcrR family transcriptional regulator
MALPMPSTPERAAQRPRRRTQEERRAATRGALLDATIDCLIEYGYANTTTTKVVERAGVSRGAQVHHFQTKASLVAEAVVRLAERRGDELRREIERLPQGHDRITSALDLLWKVHSGPLLQASLELWVAARTDRELRESLVPVEREVIAMTREICHELFGEHSKSEEFDANLQTALGAIQGLAMVSTLLGNSRRDLGRSWQPVRDRLVTLFEPAG